MEEFSIASMHWSSPFRLSGIIGCGFIRRAPSHLGLRNKSHNIRIYRSVKQLAILGSTGSIGRQCLSVVDQLEGRFGVVALAAGSNVDELAGQIERYRPELVSVGD